MPILKGAMTYTRFRVTSLNILSAEEVTSRLNLFRFRPLDSRGEDSETLGFCPFQSEYDDERPIEVLDCYFDGKIALSLRMDVLRVPKELLRVLVKKSIAAYQHQHKRFPDRTIKKEIELAESKGLRAKILPHTKIVEALWCQKSQELRIFSRSATVIDRLVELFQQSFMLKPERRDCALEAFDYNEKKSITVPVNFGHEPLYVPPLRIEVN
jgi:hypothetical protein